MNLGAKMTAKRANMFKKLKIGLDKSQNRTIIYCERKYGGLNYETIQNAI